MPYLKPAPEYTHIDPTFKPGPKNGHLSTKDAAYAEIEPAAAAFLGPMWAADLSMSEFKTNWAVAPPTIPDDCPGEDVVAMAWRRVPVRDGSFVRVKTYVAARGVAADDDRGVALVFRMHGGGWAVCGADLEEAENRYLAALGGVVVVSVDYRLAPEFPFPYPLEDSYDVLKWCKENARLLGVDPERIILVGSSAGGNLAAGLAIKARHDGLTGIVAQILEFPVTCHPKFLDRVPDGQNYELLSYVQNCENAVLDTARMEFFWDCYVGTEPDPDPRHSPLVHAAGLDPLRDEGIAFAEALHAAGNEVTLFTYKGLPHCFYSFTQFKATAEYFSRVVAFVRKHACAQETQNQMGEVHMRPNL